MKTIVLFTTLALTAATAPARADYAADYKLIYQLEAAIKANDKPAARKLIAAPNFRPLLRINADGLTVFESALNAERADIARAMMQTPGWRQTKWNAVNSAETLVLAAWAPNLFPIFQDLTRIKGFDINTPRHPQRKFPLSYAASQDNMIALRWLIARPEINLNARDKMGETALFNAGTRATKYLLSLHKFDVNARNVLGQTPLHNATAEKVAALLSARDIDPNIRDANDRPSTPLDLALQDRNIAIARVLMGDPRTRVSPAQRVQLKNLGDGVAASSATDLDADVNLNEADLKLVNRLMKALESNDVAGAKTLIAAPNFRPLMVDPHFRKTLIENAIGDHRAAIARAMMNSAGWKATRWDASNTAGPLTEAAYYPEMLPVLQELLRQPSFDLSTAYRSDGESPLFFAARNDNLLTLKWLLRQPDVRLDACNKTGQSVLFVAGSGASKTLLSLHKLDVNARDNEGKTALHYACDHGFETRARVLLTAREINPNLRDKNGHTPLDIALSYELIADWTPEMGALLLASPKVKASKAQRARFKTLVNDKAEYRGQLEKAFNAA